MTKFTPGPWKQYGDMISSEHGNICQLSTPRPESGMIEHIRLGYGTSQRSEAMANAKLIEMAPDLLEMCDVLRSWLGTFVDDEWDDITREEATKRAEEVMGEAYEMISKAGSEP